LEAFENQKTKQTPRYQFTKAIKLQPLLGIRSREKQVFTPKSKVGVNLATGLERTLLVLCT
jgi:hypothetical protein